MVLNSALGAGETFGGLEAPPTFNPLHGYPEPGYDTTGYATVASGFGGVIKGTTTEGATVSLYCIDRNTATEAGIGYDPGAWDLSRVPRLGYVLRVLERYFPATDRPTGAAGDNRRAAAVQAAIITVRPLADTALGFAALGGLIAVTTRRRPRRKFAASTTSE